MWEYVQNTLATAAVGFLFAFVGGVWCAVLVLVMRVMLLVRAERRSRGGK